MTITSYQVQNILRTYARQLSRGQRLARNRAAYQAQRNDQVNISIEARRKQVIERISSEIVNSIGNRVPGINEGLGNIDEQALTRLSLEFGRPLDLARDEKTGEMTFKVVDKEQGQVVETLSPEESGHLADRLYEITQDIIDRNMI